MVNNSINFLKHLNGFCKHLQVVIPNHFQSLRNQHRRAARIRRHAGWIEMLPAIHFNDQMNCRCIKVGDAVADRALSKKLDAEYLSAAEVVP